MRHDKLDRELRLMLLLIENHRYTVQNLCDRVGISRRNLYYYLEFFRDAGFIVERNPPYYRIRRDSPFLRKIDETIHFTEDEAIVMRRILQHTADQGLQVQRIRQKLERLYDLDILDSEETQQQWAHNLSALYEAIKGQRCVVLKGYSSPHSNSQADRMVEPFLLMNGNREVRCYEIKTHMNKTFKLSRMQDVELMDLLWSHREHHRKLFTDVFMFSGEEQMPVKLLMGRLATSVLREEYPRAEAFIEPQGPDSWLLSMPVCSYAGIARFVLGLYEDVTVLGDEGFKKYLDEKINFITNKQHT